MKTAVAVVLVAAMAVELIPEAYCMDHVVGGSSGWTQGVDYATWANGETFSVGDKLVFNYGGSHSVDQVTQSDYTNCNTGNAAVKSYSGGSNTITLSSSGSLYFICPTLGHCDGGMKLAITVGASSTTPTTTSSPPPPPQSGSIGTSGYSSTLLAVASILVVTVLGLTC